MEPKRTLIDKENRLKISLVFNLVLFINLFVLAFMYMKNVDVVNEQQTTIDTLSNELATIEYRKDKNIKELIDINKQWEDSYKELHKSSLEQVQINKDLLQENDEMANTIDEINSHLVTVEERLAVYEEYDVFMWDGQQRTDCSYDLLEYLQTLIEDKAVDNLEFYASWIMIESRWHKNIKNAKSSATGLPQFLGSTGKYVYEKVMRNGEGTYDHATMATDPKIVLPMMVAYVDKLIKTYNGDLYGAIDSYRGLHSESYIAKFDLYLSRFGLNLDKVANQTRKRYNELYKSTG